MKLRRLILLATVFLAMSLLAPAAASAIPTIISGPDGDTTAPFSTNSSTPDFVFSENNGFYANQCRVTQDTGSEVGWASCFQPNYESAPVGTGSYTFQVRSLFLGFPTGNIDSRAFTVDVTPPPAPTLTSTNPASPSGDPSPRVLGTAEAGSTVRIYSGGTCNGTPLATGSSAALASPGIQVSVPSNATTSLRATATDGADNTGACSNTLSYEEDSTGPGAPAGLATSPASPANNNNPLVQGTTAASTANVRVYKTSDCSGAFTTGTTAEFEGAGIAISVGDNTTTQISARGLDAFDNQGSCSTSISYEEDSTGPAAPTGITTIPASPANNNNPLVKGTTAASTANVRVYKTSDCSGAFATGTKAEFEGAGIAISVGDNTTTQISARGLDALDNLGTCSNSISYTEDSSGPPPPTGLTTIPASPANNNSPRVKGTTGAGTVNVRVYKTSDCTGVSTLGTKADFEGAGIQITVGDDSTTPVSAQGVNGLGNPSACSTSISYEEDSTGPAAPTGITTVPVSPANDNSPKVKGTTAAGTANVRVYKTSDCSGAFTTGTKAEFEGAGITISVSDNTTTQISARGLDALDNLGTCSSSISYEEDSTGPAAPTGITTVPVSPANDNSPKVKGTTAAGTANVRVYKTSDCSGAFTTGTKAEFEGAGITISVSDNTTTQISARGLDALDNLGTCSTSISYEEDSTGPAAPTGITTVPVSPANDNSPKVKGTTAAGTANVRVYKTSDCSGAFTTGTKAEFEGAGITISVSDNTTTQISARGLDALDNLGTCSTSISYEEDSTIPVAPSGLTTSPASPANDNNPEVAGSTDAGTVTVLVFKNAGCNGAADASGTKAQFEGPGITISVADGSSTDISAQAVNAVNTKSACSSSITYVEQSGPVDNTPPETTLDSAPAALIKVKRPAFSFNSNEPGSTFQCRFDQIQFAGCASPFTPADNLADGTHTFQVSATDPSGNVDPTPASATFRIDTTAPTARITKKPKKKGGKKGGNRKSKTSSSGSKFEFTSDEAGVGYECHIDSAAFTTCGSPYRIRGIKNGKHTFEVRAIDAIGNIGIAARAKFTYRKKKRGNGGPTVPTPPDIDPCALQPTMTGTEGNDVMTGTPGPDVINSLDGDDLVIGGGGDDLICGGLGLDDINAGSGNDIVAGVSGDDQLTGGEGNDVLLGADGNDRLEGIDGDDLLYGSTGSDVLNGGSGSDFLDGGLGNDRCDGGSDSDNGAGCERSTPFKVAPGQ